MTSLVGNLLVLQGGGPTPVLNCSLFGVVDEARRHPAIRQCLGARFGIEGLIRNDLVDLSGVSSDEIARLKTTPGASLGSTRAKASDVDLERIVGLLRQHDIRYFFFIGGNGSLRGADAIARAAARENFEVRVIGVPKTIDNDILGTDRCPGFGSAARYVAQAVRDLGMDVRSLPQPVSIYETMGRGVGWLAGASALAKADQDDAPHLVYVPERPFDTAAFLGSVDRIVGRIGWAIVVVPEGLRTVEGKPVYETPAASQRDALNRALPGGVGTYLADVVTRELKIRCRSEKPGLCGRASMLHASRQDLADAEAVGRAGVRAAIAGHSGQMIALGALEGDGSGVVEPSTHLMPLSDIAGDRAIPPEWLDDSDIPVTRPFLEYARRGVGALVDYPVPFTNRGTIS